MCYEFIYQQQILANNQLIGCWISSEKKNPHEMCLRSGVWKEKKSIYLLPPVHLFKNSPCIFLNTSHNTHTNCPYDYGGSGFFTSPFAYPKHETGEMPSLRDFKTAETKCYTATPYIFLVKDCRTDNYINFLFVDCIHILYQQCCHFWMHILYSFQTRLRIYK